ncbi:MAG: YhbY family RNA-binding protein [Treponema sp.]|nr:YhbY family RNA-binding protein [Treponema sp.]MCR5621932.1 YhbY family RNA-binding protein [Treponema sp.]
MIDLNSKQRKLLEKAAQPLSPLVIVGQEGVTDGVSAMLSAQLDRHELVKLKFNEYKEEKKELAAGLSQSTDAVLVRIIGNVAIFYRESPEQEKRMFKRQLEKLSKDKE